MSQHPLIEKSNDREVKQATGFKQAAASLKGEELAELYEREHANAPKRVDAGKSGDLAGVAAQRGHGICEARAIDVHPIAERMGALAEAAQLCWAVDGAKLRPAER